jgi:hypothetical protein
MQIATWNCNGALRNKLDAVRSLTFDIAVIQECEDPTRCADKAYQSWPQTICGLEVTRTGGLGYLLHPA